MDDKGQKYTEEVICSSNLSQKKNAVNVLIPSYDFFRHNGSACSVHTICRYTHPSVSYISHYN